MPTTLLQVPRRTFGRLRGVPQVSWHLLWRLRESRKSLGICFGVCGSPASLPVFALAFAGSPAGLPAFALAFAGVPQVSRYLLWRLRESRKSPGLCFGVCGESRKSPGICFGVCGESRKCFGEPVGRYSMLSMTFSIRVSHSFVELTLSYNHHYRLRLIVSYNRHEKEKGTAKNKFHSAFSITV